MDEVFPVDLPVVEEAKTLLFGSRDLSARHAIHIASMERNELTRTMSLDRRFDAHPGLERLRV